MHTYPQSQAVHFRDGRTFRFYKSQADALAAAETAKQERATLGATASAYPPPGHVAQVRAFDSSHPLHLLWEVACN